MRKFFYGLLAAGVLACSIIATPAKAQSYYACTVTLDPLLPMVIDPKTGAYTFAPIYFDPVCGTWAWFDPDVATGYTYSVGEGDPLITAAMFTAPLINPDGYQIYGLNADGTRGDFFGDVAVGGSFVFDSAVSGFWLEGIDVANMLDPADASAFVTGLMFDRAGEVNLTQTPLTRFVEPGTNSVPEPATWALMLTGFGLMGALMRRRNKDKAASLA